MCHERHEGPIPGDDRGCGKGQARVLHAAEGECCGENQQIVAVPRIGAVECFCGKEEFFHFGELPGRLVDEFRNRIDGTPFANGPILHLSDGQRQQVGGNGLGHPETVLAIRGNAGGVLGTHEGHQTLRHFDFCLIRESDAGTVLDGNPSAREDGLALGEQEWRFVALGLHPQERIGIGTGSVSDGDLLGTVAQGQRQWPSNERLGRSKWRKVHRCPVDEHFLDVEVMGVENDAFGTFGHADVVGRGS